jgi:hypothetical protein
MCPNWAQLLGQLALNIKLRKRNIKETAINLRNIKVNGSANGNPNFAPIKAELQSSTNKVGATLVNLSADIVCIVYLYAVTIISTNNSGTAKSALTQARTGGFSGSTQEFHTIFIAAKLLISVIQRLA